MDFGFVEGRVFNKAFKADTLVKTSILVTPDSDPTLISQTRDAYEANGISLEINNDNFQLVALEDTDKPVIDGAVAIFFSILQGANIVFNEISDQVFSTTLEDITFNAELTDDSLFIEGYTSVSESVFETEAANNDVITIDYGNAELEDILGSIPFPGQTESQRTVEIFRPPFVDGVEDFTIFPNGEGLFIPTTGFPQGDALLEDLLNDGIFLGGGDELPEGAYVLASNGNGGLTAYNPEDFSNLEGNSWDSVIKNGGDLTTLSGVEIPVRESLPPKTNRFGEEISQSTHGNFTTLRRVDNRSSRAGGDIKFISGRSPISDRSRSKLISPDNITIYNGESKTIGEIRGSINSSLFHAEAHAANTMRNLNLDFGRIVINNSAGPCPDCRTGLPRILSDGAMLDVVYKDTLGRFVTDTFTGGKLFIEANDRKIQLVDF